MFTRMHTCMRALVIFPTAVDRPPTRRQPRPFCAFKRSPFNYLDMNEAFIAQYPHIIRQELPLPAVSSHVLPARRQPRP